MNYLAHAYLSFNKAGILAGNMISDHVKGRAMYSYDAEILAGIKLHRSIDTFTDRHEIIRQIKSYFSPAYGLYSAVFTDVVLDYFLANDESQFTERPLKEFAADCYRVLENNVDIFPAGFSRIFPHMKSGDWLSNYRSETGIENSFRGLAYRAKYMDDSSAAFGIFLRNKNEMNEYYKAFFPELKIHSLKTLNELMNTD